MFVFTAQPGVRPLRALDMLWLFTIMAALTVFYMLLLPGVAHAAGDGAVPPDATRLFLPQTQLLVIIVGSLSPAVSYFLNKRAPWISEAAKGVVFVVVAAVSGVLTVLVDTGGISVDWDTGQLLLTAVAGALASHFGFWKASGIGPKLGAGQNRQDG